MTEKREFRAMGSRVLVLLDQQQPSLALDDVPGWFEEWEQILSRFRIDSELTQLNASAGSPRAVSETLYEVLDLGLEAEALTSGLVNPLVLEDLLSAGYDRPFDLLQLEADAAFPSALTFAAPRVAGFDSLPALGEIILDPDQRILCLPPGAGLDFGGVAKGWAAHQAAQRLSAFGPALVSAGGDVSVSGPLLSGEPWEVGVEDPFGGSDYIEMLYLESAGGIATSGKDHRHWTRDGMFQHHIIDPRTHQPAVTDILAATVIASTVMRAEALAKAVLISGSAAGLALLDGHDGAEGILVLDDGSRLFTRGIEQYL